MIKKNLKLMIFTSLIILAPMVFGLVMWNELPAEMATHFGTDGEPNGWSSKTFVVIGLPLMLLAIHWFCVFFTGLDPKKSNISDKMMTLIIWLVPIVSVVGDATTYMYALDNTVDTNLVGMLLLGFVFLVLGNYTPKMKQSYTLGFKLPWTLNSEENWNRTHRFTGRVMMVVGLIVLIGGLFQAFWVVFVALIVVAVVPAVYSYLLYKKGI